MKKLLTKILTCLPNYQFKGKDFLVTGIAFDSREVKKGYVFVAIKGITHDGHDFIDEAIKNGAMCVVCEKLPENISNKISYVKVFDSREALGLIASEWFDNPSEKMKVIGVTGTDGKTTTVSMIYEILKTAGKKVGMISTISAKIGDDEFTTGFHVTNPNPIDLQHFLFQMVQEKCEYAVVEVTSHGLDQGRVIGTDFNCSVLTNITEEHLDYHGTFENYRDAKIILLEAGNFVVLNEDDKSCDLIISKLNRQSDIITYSQVNKTADVIAENVVTNKNKYSFDVKTKNKKFSTELSISGKYNISNALAAISVANIYKIDEQIINSALSTFGQLEGRLEEIKNELDIRIIVDFAHTPNSLKNVLEYLKTQTTKRLICVFGCASERDDAKRPRMASIASKTADISIFTAEDPRKEDIYKILNEMKAGVVNDSVDQTGKSSQVINKNSKHAYVLMPERSEAIYFAIKKLAQKNDIVVICGKGHEKSMSYDGLEHPWNDKNFIIDLLTNEIDIDAVILAAGKGNRLNSDMPKVMHKLAGKPMLSYSVENLRRIGVSDVITVVGFGADELKDYFGHSLVYVNQDKQLGTGHAANCGVNVSKSKTVMVMYGDDNSFYSKDTYLKLIKMHKESKSTIALISLKVKNPFGLGRIIRDKNKNFLKIVEEKDATIEQKKINEVNDGVYIFDREWFVNNINKIENNNAQGEYLLTDFIELAFKQKRKISVLTISDTLQWHGINTPDQLVSADELMRKVLTNTNDK